MCAFQIHFELWTTSKLTTGILGSSLAPVYLNAYIIVYLIHPLIHSWILKIRVKWLLWQWLFRIVRENFWIWCKDHSKVFSILFCGQWDKAIRSFETVRERESSVKGYLDEIQTIERHPSAFRPAVDCTDTQWHWFGSVFKISNQDV